MKTITVTVVEHNPHRVLTGTVCMYGNTNGLSWMRVDPQEWHIPTEAWMGMMEEYVYVDLDDTEWVFGTVSESYKEGDYLDDEYEDNGIR